MWRLKNPRVIIVIVIRMSTPSDCCSIAKTMCLPSNWLPCWTMRIARERQRRELQDISKLQLKLFNRRPSHVETVRMEVWLNLLEGCPCLYPYQTQSNGCIILVFRIASSNQVTNIKTERKITGKTSLIIDRQNWVLITSSFATLKGRRRRLRDSQRATGWTWLTCRPSISHSRRKSPKTATLKQVGLQSPDFRTIMLGNRGSQMRTFRREAI